MNSIASSTQMARWSMWPNPSLVADTQQQVAAARRLLRAGQLQRYASRNVSAQ